VPAISVGRVWTDPARGLEQAPAEPLLIVECSSAAKAAGETAQQDKRHKGGYASSCLVPVASYGLIEPETSLV
jgi:hypothetical protein